METSSVSLCWIQTYRPAPNVSNRLVQEDLVSLPVCRKHLKVHYDLRHGKSSAPAHNQLSGRRGTWVIYGGEVPAAGLRGLCHLKRLGERLLCDLHDDGSWHTWRTRVCVCVCLIKAEQCCPLTSETNHSLWAHQVFHMSLHPLHISSMKQAWSSPSTVFWRMHNFIFQDSWEAV